MQPSIYRHSCFHHCFMRLNCMFTVPMCSLKSAQGQPKRSLPRHDVLFNVKQPYDDSNETDLNLENGTLIIVPLSDDSGKASSRSNSSHEESPPPDNSAHLINDKRHPRSKGRRFLKKLERPHSARVSPISELPSAMRNIQVARAQVHISPETRRTRHRSLSDPQLKLASDLPVTSRSVTASGLGDKLEDDEPLRPQVKVNTLVTSQQDALNVYPYASSQTYC